eukprot:853226-Rhodomonas_salina.1
MQLAATEDQERASRWAARRFEQGTPVARHSDSDSGSDLDSGSESNANANANASNSKSFDGSHSRAK